MSDFGAYCRACGQQLRCANCKAVGRNCACKECYNEQVAKRKAERQRNLAEEALTRVETERLEAIRERDEAREVARELLDYAQSNCGCCLGYDPANEVQEIEGRHLWLTTDQPAREAGEE